MIIDKAIAIIEQEKTQPQPPEAGTESQTPDTDTETQLPEAGTETQLPDTDTGNASGSNE